MKPLRCTTALSTSKRASAGTGIGAPVVGVAFLLQDLTDRAAVSFAGNTFTVESGLIFAVQGRVMLSVKGSGVKIPLSLSYANRTELLKEKDVRGHVGRHAALFEVPQIFGQRRPFNGKFQIALSREPSPLHFVI